MAWSTIRRATDSDVSNLTAAAVRFCNRHKIAFENEDSAVGEIESLLSVRDSSLGYAIQDKARRLRPLWSRIVRRTLGSKSAEGIAYGHVGFCV